MASAWETDTEHISIVKARAMLTQLPELLAEENRAVALTRRGKPVLAVMPWELFQSVIETLEIMGDAEMMDALRRGIRDVQEENLVPLDEVKFRLGINEQRSLGLAFRINTDPSVAPPPYQRLDRQCPALLNTCLHEPSYGLFRAVDPGVCQDHIKGLSLVVVGSLPYFLQPAKRVCKPPGVWGKEMLVLLQLDPSDSVFQSPIDTVPCQE